jgi:formamidopyrimidine-DNA glycosylase
MPEMPEVETIRRSLTDHIENKVILDVEVRLPRLIKCPESEDFRAILGGRTVKALERRAKYLLFHLNDSWVLVIHLRMTGRLFYQRKDTPSDPSAKVIFHFEGGDGLEYSDTRTLGTLYLLRENEIGRIYGLSCLGPEPLSSQFTVEYLSKGLSKRKGKMKSVLLDQSFIGGLGNIYVDESLARAGIHPERRANELEGSEIEKLHEAINFMIEKGICAGGTTLRDYRDGEGNRGTFQEELCVYGRKGLPCQVCGTEIVRTEVGGRGTHFCPQCQHQTR